MDLNPTNLLIPIYRIKFVTTSCHPSFLLREIFFTLSAEKTAENLTWCRKFCPPKFCSIRYFPHISHSSPQVMLVWVSTEQSITNVIGRWWGTKSMVMEGSLFTILLLCCSNHLLISMQRYRISSTCTTEFVGNFIRTMRRFLKKYNFTGHGG